MKKRILFGGLLAAFLLPFLSHAADCARVTGPYNDGDILYAADYDSEQNGQITCINDRLQEAGGTMTGNLLLHSGADLICYSDTGSTETCEFDGATGGAKFGLKAVGVPINLNIVNATTTNANDSIKIECGDAACSATNPGFTWLPSHTPGDRTLFKITSDVTINLTGAHWGAGTKGDLTDAILRVSAVNAAGSLVWCVNYQGLQGVTSIGSSSLDEANTASNVNLPEELWCNGNIGADDPIIELFWFRASFDDTGGAAEDLWAVQTGDGDLNTGSADGQSQPCNVTFGGFDPGAPPTVTSCTWTQFGNYVFWNFERNAAGTSNATSLTMTLPVKAERTSNGQGGSYSRPIDNGADVTTPPRCDTAAASTTLSCYETLGAGTWTNSGSKAIDVALTYEAYRP